MDLIASLQVLDAFSCWTIFSMMPRTLHPEFSQTVDVFFSMFGMSFDQAMVPYELEYVI